MNPAHPKTMQCFYMKNSLFMVRMFSVVLRQTFNSNLWKGWAG